MLIVDLDKEIISSIENPCSVNYWWYLSSYGSFEKQMNNVNIIASNIYSTVSKDDQFSLTVHYNAIRALIYSEKFGSREMTDVIIKNVDQLISEALHPTFFERVIRIISYNKCCNKRKKGHIFRNINLVYHYNQLRNNNNTKKQSLEITGSKYGMTFDAVRKALNSNYSLELFDFVQKVDELFKYTESAFCRKYYPQQYEGNSVIIGPVNRH